MNYDEYWGEINNKQDELNSLLSSYWNEYSSIATWQFWIVVAFLVIPLVILYFAVDRRRIFELFFFGYSVHVLWAYSAIFLEKSGLFIHTYFLAPILPYSISMNASLLPIGFLLVYQYCTNYRKNFYIYALIVAALFAFGVASFEKSLGLVEFRKGMNQFYIFAMDIVIVYITYWFTKFILKLRERHS